MDIFLTNTLTRQKEKFIPMDPPKVGMYTCGMTVYDFAHIGHGRKYVTDDVLKRMLTANGLKVEHVQNVTDVGHLSSDADEGEDKMEKGALKYGKTVWEVAEFYTKNFYDSMDALNIIRPDVICKATENIKEQIEMVQKLFDNGYAYDTPEAVYFDVSKFPSYGSSFGQNLSEKRVGVREEVKTDENKKNPQDFALWFKRVGRFKDHTMHWESPWGDGFPGWHIECSAMATKYLGEQFDIHTGGEDHIAVHHPNEIAQSEGASGKIPFVKYWLHTAFLMVDGTKMSKSLGNFYTIADVKEKGFDPIALRYLYLGAHYRDPLNFTWESLTASQTALNKLKSQVNALKTQNERNALSEEKNEKVEALRSEFMEAVNNDLNTAKALAVVWEMLKSNIPSTDKYDLVLSFDEVLGLNLQINKSTNKQIPDEIKNLMEKREELRKQKKYDEADKIRIQIEEAGFSVNDTSNK
ncbi:MAG TPA: cysteine--tRNA ligase [Patescibacteria group bacterium]|nr:cysteine--tRNA ligase [Patescibacteria group bacterium]